MTLLRRIGRFRVYRRLVLSYLLIIAVTIVLLCSTLYTLFSVRAVKEIDRSSSEMLSQVSYTSNVVYSQMHEVTYQLLNDNRIISFLYEKEDDKQVKYAAYLLISKVQSVYPFIANVSLYNFVSGSKLDTAGLPFQDNLANLYTKQYMYFVPRKLDIGGGKPPLQLLTFMFVPEFRSDEPKRSMIVLDVDASYIQNTMSSISASSQEANSFVIDTNGTVLSHSNRDQFMKNYGAEDYIRKIIYGDQAKGSFVQTIDRKKSLVTFVKSNTLDLYFVSVQPYSDLLSNIYELRNLTMVAGLLLFALGSGISLYLSGNIYNPIKALVDRANVFGSAGRQGSTPRLDEYHLLSRALNQTTEIMENRYMSDLLKGNRTGQSYGPEILKAWEEKLPGPYFVALLFDIDDNRSFRAKFSPQERELIRFALGNIAQEVLSKVYISQLIPMEDETVFILSLQEDVLDSELYFLLPEIQDTVKQYYQISVSISIGDVCSSLYGIKDSYETAVEQMAFRLFQGHEAIIDFANGELEQERTRKYPLSTERSIIEAIKGCSRNAVQKQIAVWCGQIVKMTPTEALQYSYFLLMTIIREFEHIVEWWYLESSELYVHLDNIQKVETMEQLRKETEQFCLKLIAIIEDHKNNAVAVKNAGVVEQIKRYVHENCAQPTLSLEEAAGQVGLSAGYTGKLFKTVTGTSFNDYLSQLRLERAKTILAEEHVTIAQVGEMVGIYNVPYFTTLFKKKFGITPSQYREQSRLRNEAKAESQ
ncbi:helix-turn-helix domain-containing protein [Paenibacillus thermotolerans]|uniref:helix-turn-helix domain-containing protein n=1 Tax=Paenibacillus thermotolerans TaxID=3027807 RepID=UPI0023687A85|nr:MULTISPECIES: helix-turn-helix domain-containing protein [unclassified Paenibacillus]